MRRALQIFRDGKKETRSLTLPLLDGEQGNLQTLGAMAQIVREDRLEPDLRIFVLREIVGGVRGHDYQGEIESIFQFARDRITYRRDPWGVERVADIWSTLYALNPNEPEGDCGIKSMFFCSCAAILGFKPFFVVIKQTPNQRAFNHVYAAILQDGEYRYFDPTPEDAPPGWEVKSYKKFLYPIF
ncbi:MAG: hypothetical protein ABIR33_07330 [Pyrinomonadaceae bacterium]